MLYFAYGSNLNKAGMARRCPDAEPLCAFTMQDARLVFRGVADCIDEPGAICPGGIWRITPQCERALDLYEGVSGGLYRKVMLPVQAPNGESEMLIYVMNSTGVMPPHEFYLATIMQGYRDFGLPLAPLKEAVQMSWDDKDKTFAERRRRHRDGYKPLARANSIVIPRSKTGKPATGSKARKSGASK